MFLRLPVEIQCEIIPLLEVRDISCFLTAMNDAQLNDMFLLITDSNDTATVFKNNIARINIYKYESTDHKQLFNLIEIHDVYKLNMEHFQTHLANKLSKHNFIAMMGIDDFEYHNGITSVNKIGHVVSSLGSKDKLLVTGGGTLYLDMARVTYPTNITVENLEMLKLRSLDGARLPLRHHNVTELFLSDAIGREPLNQMDLSQSPTEMLTVGDDESPNMGFRFVNKCIKAQDVHFCSAFEVQNLEILGSELLSLSMLNTPYGDPGTIKNIRALQLSHLTVGAQSEDPIISDLDFPKLKSLVYKSAEARAGDSCMDFLSKLPNSVEEVSMWCYNSHNLFRYTQNLKGLRVLSFHISESHSRYLTPSEYGVFPELTSLCIIDDYPYISEIKLPLIRAPKLNSLSLINIKQKVSDENLLPLLQLYPNLKEVDLRIDTSTSSPCKIGESLRYASPWLTRLMVNNMDPLDTIFSDSEVTFEKLRTSELTLKSQDQKLNDLMIEFKFAAPNLIYLNVYSVGVSSILLGSDFPKLREFRMRGDR